MNSEKETLAVKALKEELLEAIEARLSSKKAETQNESIFSPKILNVFLKTALSAVNEIPPFTAYTFDDEKAIKAFFSLIVQHAVTSALASQALLERGRESQISDNGIEFTPPNISDLLNSQFVIEYQFWYEKIKYVKSHIAAAIACE